VPLFVVGRAGSPSNTMSPGLRPTSIPSGMEVGCCTTITLQCRIHVSLKEQEMKAIGSVIHTKWYGDRP